MNWKDVLHYGGAAALVGLGLIGMTGLHIPGVQVDPMTCIVTGLAAFGIGAKADAALKAIAIFFLASSLLGSPVSAANLNPPVLKAPAYQAMPCTIASCTGWFVGANISNTGGNLDVIGTGLTGIASNGFGLGVQGGYEFWNGQWYAAILADFSYDASLNANVAGVTPSWRDRLTYGGKVRLGYSLASMFGAATTGLATPTLPQQLANSLMTPYVTLGESWRHMQPALVSGAGVEALLATNITLDAEYLRYTYNQGGTAGNVVGIPTSQTGDNEFRLSLNRHF